MYSSVNNHDKNNAILSIKELLGIIVVFAFVLYLLFPKGNIEDFLEDQGDNTNLSINYLQSLILYHPKNIQLKMILMEKYTLIGQEEKALEINHELIANSSQKKLLIELYKVEYLLEKMLYFKNQNPEELKLLKETLLAYYDYTKDEHDYLFFFAESTNIDYPYLKYHSLKNFMEESPEIVDYEFEKIAFDLANQLGYKEEAYVYLQHLINYPQISDELTEYLIYSLFERAEFTKAKKITTKLFLESQDEDELTKYFHLALYALVQDKNKTKLEVSQLIQDYANLKSLYSADITIILTTLLELGDSKEAANFSINMFYSNPESFDETGIDLALKSLLYHSELEQARALSFFAESKFKKQKYLDKTILISAWLGESEAVSALNRKGYHQYKDPIYEAYFLKHENLNHNYEILGEIYKKRIAKKEYKYLENLAKYYEYTGEINEAEAYFTKLSKQRKHKRALYYAIDFSHKNSHFEKGLKLYRYYEAKYGQEPKLHELSIQKLLALKKFDEAYALAKNVLIKKQRFKDLAWIQKDYAFLHTKLWELEKRNALTEVDFEHLILLEKELNQGEKLNYLYKNAWKSTHKSYYLSTFMYELLQEKNLKAFNKTLKALNKNDKKIINDDINFQILLAEYYMQTSNIDLALKTYAKIFQLNPNRIESHQAYLWFLMDNQVEHPRLSKKIAQHVKKLQQDPSLQEAIGLASVVAAMSAKKHKLANAWVKKLFQKNPKNKEYQSMMNDIKTLKQAKLYDEYYKMLNNEYLDAEVNLKTKHLSSRLSVNESSFSYQWKLYQDIKSKIMLKHYAYKNQDKKKNRKAEEQTTLALSLKNSNQNFLWDFKIAQIKAQRDFVNSTLNLNYRFDNFQINLDSKYQEKTMLTPKLESNALENALALKLTLNINQRTSFSFLNQKRKFSYLNGLDAGTAEHLQVNANYVLRSGYPDIAFNSYLSHHKFSKNIAADFSEFGIATSIGTVRQNTLNSSWKPFGTVAFAINDHHNLGSSLTLGVSKILKGDDSLDVLFDYYNGIGVISEPIYGLNVKYRF